jgi:hypothetical protein
MIGARPFWAGGLKKAAKTVTWLTPKLVEGLRTHGAAWALGDQAWMPSPLSLVQKFDAVTGPFAYFRLLGDRAELDAPTLDHSVIDRAGSDRPDAQAIRRLSARVSVLAFVNNHFSGYARTPWSSCSGSCRGETALATHRPAGRRGRRGLAVTGSGQPPIP